MENYIELWEKVLSKIDHSVTPVTYNIWFSKLEPIAFQNDKIILVAPLKQIKSTIEKDFKQVILDALQETSSTITNFEIVTNDEVKYIQQKQNIVLPVEPIKVSSSFNENFTFNNFVVGNSNSLAYNAALAVAENPGKAHNPLFIYGGVGLGKTHLMHAIGNYITNKLPDKKVLYVTTELFVNEFIDMIRNNKYTDIPKNFRDKYRSVDVLMLDDVQFLKNKDATQEELFHTFNDLYNNNKQIILTSDRHPKELTFLEDRLRSRFQTGLTLDISLPDYETRIAILEKKAMNKRFNIKSDLLAFIADNFKSNIRELEGALTKVMFYCQLLEVHADDISIVKEALKEDIGTQEEELTIDTIVDHVCSYYGVNKSDLKGKRKNKKIADARQICTYMIYEMLAIPLTSIGEYFGGRDRTTMLYSKNKIENLILTDKNIATQVKDIKNIINKK